MASTVRRDTLRYALAIVVVAILGVVANIASTVTDTKDLIAQLAVEKAADIKAALPGDLQLHGSLPFAAGVWFLLLSFLTVLLLFYFRSTTAASLNAHVEESTRRAERAEGHSAALEAQLQKVVETKAALRVEIERLKMPSILAEKHKATIDGMVRAASDVARDVFKAHEPKFRLTRINEVTTVQADGTATVERDYEIEGGDEPAQTWRSQIFADETAEKVDLLSDLEFRAFQVYPQDGQSLRYLLTENSPRKKEVIIFFLPAIKPGETRRFRMSYRWPRFAGDLVERSRTLFYARYHSCDPEDHASITYEMRFARNLGRLACERTTTSADGGKLVPHHNTDCWIWRYEHDRMLVHEATIQFDVRLLDREPAST